MSKILKPILCKTIFQLSYKPHLRFYNVLMSAAEKLNVFEDWETNRLFVLLRDFDNHCSVAIRHDSIAYEQDSDKLNMEEDRIQLILRELPNALEIQSFIRLGYRRKYLIPLTMSFESLVNIFNVKLFSQSEKLRDILPSKISDLIYRADYIEEPYQFHLTLGPVRKREIPQYIQYNLENHLRPQELQEKYQDIIKNYPEIALFIDIDFYRTEKNFNVEYASEFVSIARQKIFEMIDKLNEYLFSQRIDE